MSILRSRCCTLMQTRLCRRTTKPLPSRPAAPALPNATNSGGRAAERQPTGHSAGDPPGQSHLCPVLREIWYCSQIFVIVSSPAKHVATNCNRSSISPLACQPIANSPSAWSCKTCYLSNRSPSVTCLSGSDNSCPSPACGRGWREAPGEGLLLAPTITDTRPLKLPLRLQNPPHFGLPASGGSVTGNPL